MRKGLNCFVWSAVSHKIYILNSKKLKQVIFSNFFFFKSHVKFELAIIVFLCLFIIHYLREVLSTTRFNKKKFRTERNGKKIKTLKSSFQPSMMSRNSYTKAFLYVYMTPFDDSFFSVFKIF